MPTPGAVTYDSFVGGVDLGVAPYKVRPGFLPTAVNMYNTATGVRGRGGARMHVRALYGSQRDDVDNEFPPVITGIHLWSRRAPSRETELYVGTADSIGHHIKETGAWEDLPRGGSTGAARYVWSDAPWHFIQYNGVMYAFRENVGMRRITHDPQFDINPGIQPPETAGALNTGAAGTTPAAAFYLVYTFRNSQTGQESNPSPVSVVYNAPGSFTANASSVDTSVNPQVDSRRLYVTLPNQTGNYYFWQDIPNNTDTVSPDLDILVEDLGEPVSFRNNVPPSNLLFGVIWQERLWASDGRSLYASELGRPESVPPQNVLSIFPDDGEDITGLAADENRLYVGRTSKVIYLTGTVSNLERHVLDDKNGVASHGSFKLVDNRLIWFTGSDFVMSEGGPGRSLTSGEGGDGTRLKLYMRFLDREEARHTVAEVFPEEKLYLFLGRWVQSHTEDSLDGHPHSVQGSDMLALNYETGSWWPWRYRQLDAHTGGTLQPAMALRTVIDSDGVQKLLVGYRTAVNHLLAPNYNHDDLVRGPLGGPFGAVVRATFPISWTVGLPELFEAGKLVGLRRVGLAGLLHRWPLDLNIVAYRGGRYLVADQVATRTHRYAPDLAPYPTDPPLGRDNDYEWFNLGAVRKASPRLYVQLDWVYNQVFSALNPVYPVQAPPRLTHAMVEGSIVNRKKRPI